MHRIGGIQAVQVRRDKSTEVGEVLAKTIKQALGRDLQTIRHQPGEAVRTTVAHRYQSEEASLPKHDLQAVEVGGRVRATLRHANVPAFRCDSALTASLRTVERKPVSTDDQVVLSGALVAKFDRHGLGSGRKINNGKAEPVRDRAGSCYQQTLQFHPSHPEARSDPAPQIGQISRAEQVAVSIVEAPRRQHRRRRP